MSFQGHSYLFLKGCGEVTEDWKKTNVTPIFTKDKKDPGSYRLVSLTSVLVYMTGFKVETQETIS